MRVVGIDPGALGAIALYDTEAASLQVFDMPTVSVVRNKKNKNEVSPAILAEIISGLDADAVYMEKVGAMPGQGVSSMFQFGRSTGMIEGVVASIKLPIYYVTPQKWKRSVGLRGGKDGGRAKACEVFPQYARLFSRKKDNGRADAALIAKYGAELLQ